MVNPTQLLSLGCYTSKEHVIPEPCFKVIPEFWCQEDRGWLSLFCFILSVIVTLPKVEFLMIITLTYKHVCASTILTHHSDYYKKEMSMFFVYFRFGRYQV